MPTKEFSNPEKLEIWVSKNTYQLAEAIGLLCGYERYGPRTGKDRGHFHSVQDKVILYISRIEW